MKRLLLLIFCALQGAAAQSPPGDTWRLFEENLQTAETVENDFFGVANDLDLGGIFQKDLWAGGRKIHFHGQAGDDVRLFALEVLTVEGQIKGNLRGQSSLGNILLNTNAVVAGHAVLQAGKRVMVKGRVEGDLWVESPKVMIEGEVLGDLTLRAEEVQLMPGTVIHGNLYNRNAQPLPLPEGVEVKGEREQVSLEPGPLAAQMRTWKWILLALQFFTAYIIGLLMLRTLPRFTGQSVDLLLHHRSPSMTLGILAVPALGISGYFLLGTLIGTGLGIFLLVITGLLFYIGKIPVAFALGLILLRQKTDLTFGKLALGLFIGLLVLYSAYSLNYLGHILYVITSCWGMGTLLTGIRQSQRVLKIELPAASQPTPPDTQ